MRAKQMTRELTKMMNEMASKYHGQDAIGSDSVLRSDLNRAFCSGWDAAIKALAERGVDLDKAAVMRDLTARLAKAEKALQMLIDDSFDSQESRNLARQTLAEIKGG